MEMERKRNTHNSWGSSNGPSIRGRVGLTLKLDELLGHSMTFEVILIKMKYLRIHNISIHIILYQNRFINECVRKNFLKLTQIMYSAVYKQFIAIIKYSITFSLPQCIIYKYNIICITTPRHRPIIVLARIKYQIGIKIFFFFFNF